MAVPALEVRSITKRFGEFVALRDVSVSLEPGELLAVLGPSGCGKTTLLRIIAGLERQDEGSVRIAGRDVSKTPTGARRCGIVFQSYALFPNLTAEANVAYGMPRKGMTRAARRTRARELLELVGLPDSHAKVPFEMSGGQQQRVALARAPPLGGATYGSPDGPGFGSSP